MIQNEDDKVSITGDEARITVQGEEVDLDNLHSKGTVYILLDCSSSMAEGRKLQQAKDGSVDFAKEAIEKGYLVGLIKFDTYAVHVCDPQKDVSAFRTHFDGIRTTGNTNMTKAIEMATRKLIRTSGLRVMLIATDGMPNNPDSALAAASGTKGIGIEILTIGTDNANISFLQKLATRSDLALKVPEEQFRKAIGLMANNLKALPSGKKD